jgi:hypothetical protein
MIEVYHFGCAVGLALSSLGFGFGFGLGMYVAWVTERPDTPRVVSRGTPLGVVGVTPPG